MVLLGNRWSVLARYRTAEGLDWDLMNTKRPTFVTFRLIVEYHLQCKHPRCVRKDSGDTGGERRQLKRSFWGSSKGSARPKIVFMAKIEYELS